MVPSRATPMIPSSDDSSKAVSKCSRVKLGDTKRKPSFREGNARAINAGVPGARGSSQRGILGCQRCNSINSEESITGKTQATRESHPLHGKVIAAGKYPRRLERSAAEI